MASWTALKTWVAGAVLPASDLNTYLRDNLTFLYGDTSWTAPTFTNSWVDFGGTCPAAGFRLVGTRVVLRGAIKSGTINTAAFTLPAGYRPTGSVTFAVNSNGSYGAATITSAGVFTPAVGSNVAFNLDGISFDTI